jgi:hypothetical protein
MQMHVSLDENGNPIDYAAEAFEGSVLLDVPDAVVIVPAFMAAHRWDRNAWVRRPPEPEPELAPEEIAAAKEAAYQAALDDRDKAIDAMLLESEPFRQLLRGELTLAAYNRKASELAMSIPMPERAQP